MGPPAAAAAIPAWVGYMSMAVSAATAMGSAYMQRQAAVAQQASAKINANNTRIAKLKMMDEARAEESRLKLETGLFRASQIAFTAGQGDVVSRGSALKAETDTMTLGKMDTISLQNRISNAGWGYDVQAAGFEAEGAMARMMGTWLPSLTLLGGAAEAAGIYTQIPKKVTTGLETTNPILARHSRVTSALYGRS